MARGKIKKLGVMRQDIVNLLQMGFPDDEIMQITGWCPSLVERIRHHMGIKHERYLSRPDLFAVVAQLTNTNRPYSHIADENGMSHRCISIIAKQLRAAGITVQERTSGRPRGTN